tara:strand:+ start:515 stop:802 length:288 start_codon:yes stop_codon:yes gene_type:complete
MKVIIKMNKTEQLCTILNINIKKNPVEIIIKDNSKKIESIRRKKRKNKETVKKYCFPDISSVKNNRKTNQFNNFYAQSKIFSSPNPSDLPLPTFN